ncbi:phage tail tip lysozyme [Novosphingobium rosa]|uniref:phage tail tip lysozyme n=1 Tax=Novosphingobium rosa TaxID=76978 RepID=UPI00082F0CB4|nr:phage tail tip lysozyme [Novosphingobium rosa]
MGGVIGAMQPRVDQWGVAPKGQASDSDAKPTPWWQAAAANWRVADDDDPAHNLGNLVDGYNTAADALVSLGYAADRYRPAGHTILGNTYDVPEERRAQVWADIAAARRKDPTLFKDYPQDQGGFEQWVRGRQGGRAADLAAAAKGGIGSAIAPGLVHGFTDLFENPEHAALFAYGGGAQSVAGLVLRQGLGNAIASGLMAPTVAATREKMGVGTTREDLDQDLLTGFAGGALLTGAHVAVARGVPAALDRFAPGFREGQALGGMDLPGAPNADIAGAFSPDQANGPTVRNYRPLEPMSDAEAASAFAGGVKPEYRTPDEAAALNITWRNVEVDGANPYANTHAGQDMHQRRLAAAGQRLLGGPARSPVLVRGLDPEIVSYFIGKGASPEVARGIAAGIAAESGSNPRIVNPSSGATGLGQWLGARKARLMERTGGQAPTKAQQLDFLWEELKGGDPGGKHVLGAKGEAEALDAYVRRFMRPKAGMETDSDLRRGMAALGRGEDAPVVASADEMPMAPDGTAVDTDVLAADAEVRDATADIDRLDDGAGARRSAPMDDDLAPRIDGGMADRHPSQDLPPLREDLFDIPEAHQAAQAQADRDALGLDGEPTQQQSAASEPIGFSTSKGSTYRVEADGSTTRNKAPRPEHPGEHERGWQPTSEQTFYVGKDDLQRFSVFQAHGGDPMRVVVDRGHAALQYTDGPNAGKIVKGTVAPISTRPDIGLYPVETWKDGARVHFGNEITMLQHASPEHVAARAREAAPAEAGSEAAAPTKDTTAAAAAEAGLVPPDLAPPPAVREMSDPVGAGARDQLDGMMHDVRGMVDAGDLDGVTFDIGDGAQISAAELLARIEGDAEALKALRDCM